MSFKETHTFPKTFQGDLAISFGLITPSVPIYFFVKQAYSEPCLHQNELYEENVSTRKD